MKPTHIIIHHSATPDGTTVSWDAIRKYHMDPNGPYKMVAIGYHFGVELVGSHYEILVGRHLTEEGAHCKDLGMNHHSIGICIIGNFDKDVPPLPQWLAALRLTRSMMELFGISKQNVLGHFETGAPKTCPGKLFRMDNFRNGL